MYILLNVHVLHVVVNSNACTLNVGICAINLSMTHVFGYTLFSVLGMVCSLHILYRYVYRIIPSLNIGFGVPWFLV